MTAEPAARPAASLRDTESRTGRWRFRSSTSIPRTARPRGWDRWIRVRIHGRRIEVPAATDDPPPARASQMLTMEPMTAVPAVHIHAVPAPIPSTSRVLEPPGPAMLEVPGLPPEVTEVSGPAAEVAIFERVGDVCRKHRGRH